MPRDRRHDIRAVRPCDFLPVPEMHADIMECAMTDHDEHQQMVTDCENRESKLTDWERSFIDSISRQLADGRRLSEKQAERLDAIWERVT